MKICEERHPNFKAVGGAVREIRRGLEMSQGELANQSGLARTTIHCLERGKYKTVSLEILESVACVFNMSAKDILSQAAEPALESLKKGRESRGEFIVDYPEEGMRIISWLPRRKDFFLGYFFLQPQREISNGALPRSKLLFFEVTGGKMLVTFPGRDVVLKEKEYLFFDGRLDYRLYNPDPLFETQSLITAFPSFL